MRALASESLRHPPAVEIWAYAEPDRVRHPAESAVEALAEGAAAALFRLPRDPREVISLGLLGVDTRYAAGARASTRRPAEACALKGIGEWCSAVSSARPSSNPSWSTGRRKSRSRSRRSYSWMPRWVREVRSIDPVSGEAIRIRPSRQPEGGHRLALPGGDLPGLVLFRQAAVGGGPSLPPEEIAIASSRGLTAEEIISRHQTVQRDQENRLNRFTANIVSNVYKLASCVLVTWCQMFTS